MSKPCDLCKEKDKRIHAILKAARRDKKYLAIACAVLLVELILTLANGKDGIMMGLELITGLIK
jgi:hypothetical protein